MASFTSIYIRCRMGWSSHYGISRPARLGLQLSVLDGRMVLHLLVLRRVGCGDRYGHQMTNCLRRSLRIFDARVYCCWTFIDVATVRLPWIYTLSRLSENGNGYCWFQNTSCAAARSLHATIHVAKTTRCLRDSEALGLIPNDDLLLR